MMTREELYEAWNWVGEARAEAGSSAHFSGYDGYDGISQWNQENRGTLDNIATAQAHYDAIDARWSEARLANASTFYATWNPVWDAEDGGLRF